MDNCISDNISCEKSVLGGGGQTNDSIRSSVTDGDVFSFVSKLVPPIIFVVNALPPPGCANNNCCCCCCWLIIVVDVLTPESIDNDDWFGTFNIACPCVGTSKRDDLDFVLF